MFMAIWGEFLPFSKNEIHISMWYDIDVEVLWCSLTSNPVLGAVEETSSSACVKVESVWLVRGGGRVITFFLIITFSIFNVHLLMEPNNLVYPQEELILEIINNPKCKPKVFSHSYLRSIVVLLLVTLVVRNFHLLLTHANKYCTVTNNNLSSLCSAGGDHRSDPRSGHLPCSNCNIVVPKQLALSAWSFHHNSHVIWSSAALHYYSGHDSGEYW